ENQTITIEYRWDDGNAERDAEIAAEFVHRQVDVIVTYGAAAEVDSERTLPCAHAHARAREKSLKNFRLVPWRRRYVQRSRALAVIIPIMPTSELVWLVRQ